MPGHMKITPEDRKSTRLNSSHGYISYAVFCLKKKRWRAAALHVLIHALDGLAARNHPVPSRPRPGRPRPGRSMPDEPCRRREDRVPVMIVIDEAIRNRSAVDAVRLRVRQTRCCTHAAT